MTFGKEGVKEAEGGKKKIPLRGVDRERKRGNIKIGGGEIASLTTRGGRGVAGKGEKRSKGLTGRGRETDPYNQGLLTRFGK